MPHMSKTGKLFLGIGAVGVVGAVLYALFKKNGVSLIPSDPSEWSLPSFTMTQDFLTPPSPCSCPPGATPTRRADGSCSCPTLSVEVITYGSKCRSTAQCPNGICINGECRPESEWEGA